MCSVSRRLWGALPPPPTPPAGAGGTRSRLVRGWKVLPRGVAECRAVGGAGKVPSRRKPTGGLPPPYEPPAKARHWRAGSLVRDWGGVVVGRGRVQGGGWRREYPPGGSRKGGHTSALRQGECASRGDGPSPLDSSPSPTAETSWERSRRDPPGERQRPWPRMNAEGGGWEAAAPPTQVTNLRYRNGHGCRLKPAVPEAAGVYADGGGWVRPEDGAPTAAGRRLRRLRRLQTCATGEGSTARRATRIRGWMGPAVEIPRQRAQPGAHSCAPLRTEAAGGEGAEVVREAAREV